jgi:phosphopantetheinyl transferase (holo-ACP synthase)
MKKLISTGNDIVDLAIINSARTCEKKFYSKILADSEILLYELKFSHLAFDIYVWLLWSAKESAYKCLKRLKPDLVFSPTNFLVTHVLFPERYPITNLDITQIEETGFTRESIKGIINFEGNRLHFCSIIKKEFVMSVVNEDENFDRIYWGIKLIDKLDAEYQSKAVRDFVLNRLKSYFSDDIKIIKNIHGVPMIPLPGKEIPIPVSLSHHHLLVAYSFQL